MKCIMSLTKSANSFEFKCDYITIISRRQPRPVYEYMSRLRIVTSIKHDEEKNSYKV